MNTATFTTASFRFFSTLSHGIKAILSVLSQPSIELLIDIPFVIDNQYFGIMRRVTRFLLTYNIVPCKMCFYMHRWPKSVMVLNCAMLEPDAVGKFGLLYKSNLFRNYCYLLCPERTTNIEKWTITLQLLAEKQVERLILICFDRKKKYVKRAASPWHYLCNLIILFHFLRVSLVATI